MRSLKQHLIKGETLTLSTKPASRRMLAPVRHWFDRLIGDRWVHKWDQIVSQPSFQRWSAAFPLTRPIARQRASKLFDLCAGFVYSQVLYACVRLTLFEVLLEGPQTIDVLAARLALSTEATARLIAAATALDLVERRSAGRVGLGRLGAALSGNDAIAAMINHHAILYADLKDPVALLRGEQTATGLGDYWPYSNFAAPCALDDGAVAGYSTLMSASQPLVATEILDAYSLAHHRRILDVGGGEGAFLAAVGLRWPHLELMLFDLPAVATRAVRRHAELGTVNRLMVTGGDFLSDALPNGADLVTLVRVLHDHDDPAALRLLRAIHRALPAGGALLVAEPMAETRGAEPMGDAYFGMYLLAMGQGRPRSREAIIELLRTAGFGHMQSIKTSLPLQVSVLVAQVVSVTER